VLSSKRIKAVPPEVKVLAEEKSHGVIALENDKILAFAGHPDYN
jgi:glutamine amidotransferase PdxT